MDENKEGRDDWKTRAFVVRCSDSTFFEILSVIRTLPDCYLVFSKSSNLRLVIKEEVY